jgi:hypothetical protein
MSDIRIVSPDFTVPVLDAPRLKPIDVSSGLESVASGLEDLDRTPLHVHIQISVPVPGDPNHHYLTTPPCSFRTPCRTYTAATCLRVLRATLRTPPKSPRDSGLEAMCCRQTLNLRRLKPDIFRYKKEEPDCALRKRIRARHVSFTKFQGIAVR